MKINADRSDLPAWPAIYAEPGRIDVVGRHGTPLRHRAIAGLVLLASLVYLVGVALAYGPALFAATAPEVRWHAGIIVPVATPLLLLALLATPWVRFHFVSPYLFTRPTRVTFDLDGIRVQSGSLSSTRAFDYVGGAVEFRVIDHPKARRIAPNHRKLNPFAECGRVELIHGERRFPLADIAWRDRATDFAACCNWAMRNTLSGGNTLTTFDAERHRFVTADDLPEEILVLD